MRPYARVPTLFLISLHSAAGLKRPRSWGGRGPRASRLDKTLEPNILEVKRGGEDILQRFPPFLSVLYLLSSLLCCFLKGHTEMFNFESKGVQLKLGRGADAHRTLLLILLRLLWLLSVRFKDCHDLGHSGKYFGKRTVWTQTLERNSLPKTLPFNYLHVFKICMTSFSQNAIFEKSFVV